MHPLHYSFVCVENIYTLHCWKKSCPTYSVVHLHLDRTPKGILYFSYRGSSFLTVVWSGSSPIPSPLSYLPATHMKTEKERHLPDGIGGRGWARSRIIRPQESLVLYKSLNNLCRIRLKSVQPTKKRNLVVKFISSQIRKLVNCKNECITILLLYFSSMTLLRKYILMVILWQNAWTSIVFLYVNTHVNCTKYAWMYYCMFLAMFSSS